MVLETGRKNEELNIWKGKEKEKFAFIVKFDIKKENIIVSSWNSISKYFKVSDTQNTLPHYLYKLKNKCRSKELPRGNNNETWEFGKTCSEVTWGLTYLFD